MHYKIISEEEDRNVETLHLKIFIHYFNSKNAYYSLIFKEKISNFFSPNLCFSEENKV